MSALITVPDNWPHVASVDTIVLEEPAVAAPREETKLELLPERAYPSVMKAKDKKREWIAR